jgi:hypothetical protein
MADEPRIVVQKVRSNVPVPWRLRLRHWWMMRRLSPRQRELMREIDETVERRFLGL